MRVFDRWEEPAETELAELEELERNPGRRTKPKPKPQRDYERDECGRFAEKKEGEASA